MAEEEKKPGVSIPLPWGGEATAFGFDVVLLLGMVILGWMIHEQNGLLDRQNILVHEQTAQLLREVDESRCILGISIFTNQFPRGQIDWDQLPVSFYKCLPEFSKKLPPVK